VLGAGLVGGCGGADQSDVPDPASFQSHSALTADWNDVDAAAERAAYLSEMAFMEAWTNDAGQRVCKLRTIRDETAWLLVERVAAGSPSGESVALKLSARVGVFGNPDSEARLLRNVQSRLRELHGVATCEID
jgi:hypothetical protein